MSGLRPEVERLFLEALDQPAEHRESWMRSRADVPSEARERVLALLRADRTLGTSDAAAEPARERAGPYELLCELGRGAGGVVWLARRVGSPVRTVALKITDSREPEILTRFRGEASALARLEHPGIAAIFEFGELEDGRAWFAMTLVAGEPIVRHCETSGLGTEARVRLVAQACEAVSHAHRRGILHRDLKPSNILVDVRTIPPRPVVIDLGLAKAIEGDPLSEAERTMPGRILGTPEFMAPEQALGSAPDVRMDVFSLGGVLAAAVTGGPPRSREALVRSGLPLFAAIAAVPPARPSRSIRADADRDLARSRWRDLDAIVLKAIAIDPSDRYESVADLEQDLQRWLAGVIPEAARAHPVRRTIAWIRRHRGWAAASTLGAIGAVVAVVLVLAAAANARRERHDADTLLTMVESMLIAADPWYVRGTRSPVVEQGLARSEAMLRGRSWGDSPRVALLRARCLLVASDDAEAIEAARRALELEAGNDPALRAEAMIVEAYAREHSRADQELSFRLADDAVDLARTVLAPHDRRLLEMELARGRIVTRRDPLVAIDVLQETLVRSRETLGSDDPLTLRIEQALHRAFGFTGDTEQSIPMHRELLDRCRRVLGPGHPVTMAVAGGLVNSLAYANDWDGTIAIYREIDPLLQESVGPNSSLRLAMMNSVGFALTAAGRFDEAIEVLDECARRYRELHDPVHPLTTLAERNLMVALERAGRLEEAIKRLELHCSYPPDDRQPTRLEIDRGNLEVLRRKLADARGGCG